MPSIQLHFYEFTAETCSFFRLLLPVAFTGRARADDPGALTGRIEVDHVTFAYKEGGPLVLDDVSLHAMPGVGQIGP